MGLRIVVVLVYLLSGCSSPAPPSVSPLVASTPAPALLTVGAYGQVSCPNYGGCRPSIVIRPATTGSPAAIWTVGAADEIVFPSTPHGGPCLCTWDVGARASQPPRSLQPGRYVIAGIVDTLSDDVLLPAFGSTPLPTPASFDVEPRCLSFLAVQAGAAITIEVTFSASGTCTIEAVSPR